MLHCSVLPVLFLLQVFLASGHTKNVTLRVPSSCTARWAKLEDSTMCAYHDSASASGCGVSALQQQHILAIHNDLRTNVSPTQKNMLKMHWNDDLAALAQKWAKVCRTHTDGNNQREVPGWGEDNYVAQSMAWGSLYGTWEKAIRDAWWSGVDDFVYGSEEQNGQVLSYIMLARDEANQVGCGHCLCSGTPHFVCNYYRGPNLYHRGEPYQDGVKCSGCSSCTNGLCDCGSKVCKNGGTLNIANCQCECSTNWVGDDCAASYDCPAEDDWNCGGWYEPEDCEIYDNVPDVCPYMCGLCSGDCKDLNPSCPDWADTGFCEANPDWMRENCPDSCNMCPSQCVDLHTSCPEWAETGMCEANPDWMKENCQASCNFCSEYDAFRRNVTNTTGVKQMTVDRNGTVPTSCGDKECKNGGILNIANCECMCFGDWIGDDCSKFDCPAEDDSRCGDWYKPEDCDSWSYIREACPYMCGLCSSTQLKQLKQHADCADLNPGCPAWAESGLCEANRDWMAENCKASCNLCPSACVDLHPSCPEWAETGMCEANPDWMKENCKASCNLCSGATTPQPTTTTTAQTTHHTTTDPGACFDLDQVNCEYWKNNGDCPRYPDYMKVYCRKSCGWCEDGETTTKAEPSTTTDPSTCQDVDKENCAGLANVGWCGLNPDWMRMYCKRTCGWCDDNGCIDTSENCEYWASVGECENNPDFMLEFCKLSCAVC